MRVLFLAFGVVASLGLAGCDSAPQNAQANAASHAPGAAGGGLAIVEKAEGLSTAGRLLKTAGLERLLQGPGSYTIFAPSDEAFAALPGDERKLLESEEGR